ncbi:hypothetical protein, partial [Agrobacterium tumefaciens]|uniref:hypothetical protein n=1 Tax=Agrobacterium tumefaciens TaxID=358 RepID=UPI003BA08550
PLLIARSTSSFPLFMLIKDEHHLFCPDAHSAPDGPRHRYFARKQKPEGATTSGLYGKHTGRVAERRVKLNEAQASQLLETTLM